LLLLLRLCVCRLLLNSQFTVQSKPLQLNNMMPLLLLLLLLLLLQSQAVKAAAPALPRTFCALPASFDFIFVLPLLHYTAHQPHPLSKHHSRSPAPC
jgi:hypothetical protein